MQLFLIGTGLKGDKTIDHYTTKAQYFSTKLAIFNFYEYISQTFILVAMGNNHRGNLGQSNLYANADFLIFSHTVSISYCHTIFLST